MRRFESRFDDDAADPMAAMGSLVDVMLVFACGLMAALVLGQQRTSVHEVSQPDGEQMERGKLLDDVPTGIGNAGGGDGYEPVGRVFRDPKTGELLLIETQATTAATP